MSIFLAANPLDTQAVGQMLWFGGGLLIVGVLAFLIGGRRKKGKGRPDDAEQRPQHLSDVVVRTHTDGE